MSLLNKMGNFLAVAKNTIETALQLIELVIEMRPLGVHGTDAAMWRSIKLAEKGEPPQIVKDWDIVLPSGFFSREAASDLVNGVPPRESETVNSRIVGIGTGGIEKG